jgi:hypothetical protein
LRKSSGALRPDRVSSLKQRLRTSADAFDFDALLEGVSTLEEGAAQDIAASPGTVEATPLSGAQVVEASPAAGTATQTLRSPTSGASDVREERLRAAITSLCGRLIRELEGMSTAMRRRDAERAGFCLAQVNETLDLLQSVDPSGDTARGLSIAGAPPAGRRWLDAAWSLLEFAESPLSGLLPRDADDTFAREVVRAAWESAS